MTPRQESLINRWIEGDLPPAEAAAVERLLAEDPEARRVCYDLLAVDRLLEDRMDGKSEPIGLMDAIASDTADRRARFRPRSVHWAALAAAVVFLLAGVFFLQTRHSGESATGPIISGSTDSRITIAQRQDTSHWAVGELLRLERGTASIRLNKTVSANFEGPAAIELLDPSGNVRIMEGRASVDVGPGRTAYDMHVPGGVLRDLDSRYITEVMPDGITNVRVESGFLEVRPRDAVAPVYLKSGDALRLDPDGKYQPIRLPNFHFRSGLPRQMALFLDDFNAEDNTALTDHNPRIGKPWSVLSETNPTQLRNRRLDTSSGARRLVANLANHGTQGPRAVYIFSFDLAPPEWIHDKVKRQGGIEYLTLLDASDNPVVSIAAKASNSHRWQLVDERTKATTALTPVCALWTHSLTLCYGLDGLVTLHDGATAQAPIIAELHVSVPPSAAGILIGNFDGGDLALSRMEATLLPAPPADPQ